MRRVNFFIATVILLFSILSAGQQTQTSKPLTNADVVKMVKAGLDESTVLLAIKQHASQFDTSTDALIDLKTQGVPQSVIHAMLTASTPGGGAASPSSSPEDNRSAGNGKGSNGKWRRVEDKSAFDDSRTVTFLLDGEGSIQGPVRSQVPTLIVRCKERKTSVYVSTGMSASVEYGTDSHRVRLRLDDGRPFIEGWSEATSNDALFAPEAIEFLKQLAEAKRLAFEFTPFNAPPQVVQFEIAGLGGQLAAQDVCAWDKIFAKYQGLSADSSSGKPAPNPGCPIAITQFAPFATTWTGVKLKLTYQNTTQKEIVGITFGGEFYDDSFQKKQSRDDLTTSDHLKPDGTATPSWPMLAVARRIGYSNGRRGEVFLLKAAFADGSAWEDNGSRSCRAQSWQDK